MVTLDGIEMPPQRDAALSVRKYTLLVCALHAGCWVSKDALYQLEGLRCLQLDVCFIACKLRELP